MPLTQLDTDLWVTEAPLRFAGIEMGARMTVVRLPDGKLWLHSPIEADADLVAEVRALGPVAYLIAPNRFHHMYVESWKQACPEAALYVAPGLESKRDDLEVAGVLGDVAEPGWKGTLEQVALDGIPLLNEVDFFHAPSSTLIATDLAFNLGPHSAPLTRVFAKLNRVYGKLSPTMLERIMVRDRHAFRATFDRLMAWPFERVIVAHGAVKETGGREELISGYHWLFPSS